MPSTFTQCGLFGYFGLGVEVGALRLLCASTVLGKSWGI